MYHRNSESIHVITAQGLAQYSLDWIVQYCYTKFLALPSIYNAF